MDQLATHSVGLGHFSAALANPLEYADESCEESRFVHYIPCWIDVRSAWFPILKASLTVFVVVSWEPACD